MSRGGPLSERALILTPTGRDAALASAMLNEGGFAAKICAEIPTLVGELERGAALAILADEAIHAADSSPLVAILKRQPAWSDFPIILLTGRGGGMSTLRDPAGRAVVGNDRRRHSGADRGLGGDQERRRRVAILARDGSRQPAARGQGRQRGHRGE